MGGWMDGWMIIYLSLEEEYTTWRVSLNGIECTGWMYIYIRTE